MDPESVMKGVTGLYVLSAVYYAFDTSDEALRDEDSNRRQMRSFLMGGGALLIGIAIIYYNMDSKSPAVKSD